MNVITLPFLDVAPLANMAATPSGAGLYTGFFFSALCGAAGLAAANIA